MPVSKKKVSKERGLSDSHLLMLCRQAVHVVFHDRCYFCKRHSSQVSLEHHHIVKRKMFLLRYSWRNGVLLCRECHNIAETPEGKHMIDELISPFRKYLQDRSGNCKDWLVQHGMTKTDYKRQMFIELKEILLGDYDNPPF